MKELFSKQPIVETRCPSECPPITTTAFPNEIVAALLGLNIFKSKTGEHPYGAV